MRAIIALLAAVLIAGSTLAELVGWRLSPAPVPAEAHDVVSADAC